MVGVGDVVRGVRVDELAARGGSSNVYRGTELASGSTKAIKVLHRPEQASVRRLQREAALLEGLEHPAVVPFHGIVSMDDDLALLTNWIDGTSLLERQRADQSFSITEVLDMLSALADGLDYLHRKDILHRDVSPANVILAPGGQPVLIDLGIGHLVGESTMTSRDLVAGTPQYLAPEIIRGEPATPRSDQYSLAMVLYELVSGTSPFPTGESVATALHHQVHTSPIPLDELRPEVPVALAAAVDQALSKNPAHRYDSLRDFAQAARSGPNAPHRVASDRASTVRAVAMLLAVVGIAAALLWSLGDGDKQQATLTEREEAGIASTAERPDGAVEPVSETLIQPATDRETDSTVDVANQADGTVGASESINEPGSAGTTPEPTNELGTPIENTTAAWPLGTAASSACNLLVGTEFENGSVPVDYFGNPPGREQVVSSGGYDDSWALEVGVANNYGQYGEVVPITPGESYVFSGWFSQVGDVADATMGITFLDAGYQGLDLSVTTDLTPVNDRFAQARFDRVPSSAAFAVPFLFKDASPGVILADELVFGTQSGCEAALAQLD